MSALPPKADNGCGLYESRSARPQQIADFGEQLLLLGQRGRLLGFLRDHPPNGADRQEQHEGDDDEVNDDGEKIPQANIAPCFFASINVAAVTLGESGMK